MAAGTFYVEPPGGGGAGSGTEESPWNGFSSVLWGTAAGAVGPGATLLVAPGTYAGAGETMVVGANGTSWATPIVIRGFSSDPALWPVIDGEDARDRLIDTDNKNFIHLRYVHVMRTFLTGSVGIGIFVDGNDTLLEDFKVSDCDHFGVETDETRGVGLFSAARTRIRRGTIRDVRQDGIGIGNSCADVWIDDVDIDRVDLRNLNGDCIGFDAGGLGNGMFAVTRSRLVKQNGSKQCLVSASDGTVLLARNLFLSPEGNNMGVLLNDGALVRVVGNTFSGFSDRALRFDGESAPITQSYVSGNLFTDMMAPFAECVSLNDGGTHVVSHNTFLHSQKGIAIGQNEAKNGCTATIAGNIFFGIEDMYVEVFTDTATAHTLTFQGDNYGDGDKVGGWRHGTALDTVAAWAAASGETGHTATDPLVDALGNLAPSSPARGAATWVAGLRGHDDLPLPLHPDIGAVQDRSAPGRRHGVGSA